MTSGEISKFIGKNVFMRKLAFKAIYWTTLREWYIKRGLENAINSVKPEFNYLDAGSGFGQTSFAIAKKFHQAKVTGIEIDPLQVEACNRIARSGNLKNLDFFQGDLAKYNFHNEFDVIFCGSVLEHIADDEKTLEKFYDALKEKGQLLVYVPTSEKRVLPSLERKMKKMIRESGNKYLHDHVRYYSVDELTQKLKAAGFKVKETTITYGDFGRLAYDIFTTVQYSPIFKYIFPFYLMLVHPFVLTLMAADFMRDNRHGNGLMVLAEKR